MSDLAFHIREFVPACNGKELEQRQALLKARDYAAMLRSRAINELARQHAIDAHEMAGAFVYADVSVEHLIMVVAYCRNLVHAALLLDNLELLGEVE